MYTEFSGKRKNGWNAVIAHGSTQFRTDLEQPLGRFVSRYVQIVYLVDLPGHGNLQLTQPTVTSLDAALQQMKEQLLPLISHKKVFYIGYSLGGLLGVKLIEFLDTKSIDFIGFFIGTGLRITKKSSKKIQMFFSEEYFKSAGWIKLIEQHHGKYWQFLLQSLNEWLSDKSDIVLQPEKFQLLKTKIVYFVLGDRDQPFALEDLTYAGISEQQIIKISCDHFGYFHPKIGWPMLKSSLQEIINKLS